MGLDISHGCWEGAYSAFMRWRQQIAEVAGIPLMLMDGFCEWCYACGAIRPMQRVEGISNGFAPAGKWVKPVGKGGENPAMKGIR
jgi:hypothetical protein